MSVREIRAFIAEHHGTQVSPDFISSVTDEVIAWRSRPLDPMYPVVFFDALRVKIRSDGIVSDTAVYLALAILPDGTRDGFVRRRAATRKRSSDWIVLRPSLEAATTTRPRRSLDKARTLGFGDRLMTGESPYRARPCRAQAQPPYCLARRRIRALPHSRRPVCRIGLCNAQSIVPFL